MPKTRILFLQGFLLEGRRLKMHRKTLNTLCTISLALNVFFIIVFIGPRPIEPETNMERANQVTIYSNEVIKEGIKGMNIHSNVRNSPNSNEKFWSENIVDCNGQSLRPGSWQDMTWTAKDSFLGCYIRYTLQWLAALKSKEQKIYSQYGEDGITLELLSLIGHGTSFFVEFGTQNATECNTRILRERYGWKGVMFDNNNENLAIGLNKRSVWVDNVVELFTEQNVPSKFDVLSVDTDFSDFWLLERVLNEGGYKPRVIIIETNKNLGAYASCTVPKSAAKQHKLHDRTRYYGTSVLALTKMVSKFGYNLLYVGDSGGNAFFVHKDEFNGMDFAMAHWAEILSSQSKHMYSHSHYIDYKDRTYHHICQQTPCLSSNTW